MFQKIIIICLLTLNISLAQEASFDKEFAENTNLITKEADLQEHKKDYFKIFKDLYTRFSDIIMKPKETYHRIINDPALVFITPLGIIVETTSNIINSIPGSEYIIPYASIPKKSKVKKVIGRKPKLKKLPQTFNITIWNIFKGKNEGWQDSLNDYIELSDILLIQEAELNPEQLKFYKDHDNLQWIMAQSWFVRNEDGLISTGALTGSKYKSYKKLALHSPTKENTLNTPKTAVITKYAIEDNKDKLLVINIHALNFVSVSIFERHVLQMEKFIKKHKGPIIFGGDFNTWTYSKLEILRGIMKENQLTEVTFEDDKRVRLNALSPAFDQCFTRGLDVISTEVIEDNTSDHNALVIKLKLNKGL